MTEAEINLAIAKIEYPDESVSHLNDPDESESHLYHLDYCKYWSDIGPIIEREKINLEPLVDGWSAGGYALGVYAHAETPTKAAALCYLKMRESE